MALTFQELQRKRREQGIPSAETQPSDDLVDESLFEGWPSFVPSSEGAQQPEDLIDESLFEGWPSFVPASDTAQPGGAIASPSGEFASQKREPRVLGYDQRTLAELEHGLAGLRPEQIGAGVAALAGASAIGAVPRATLSRLAREAEQEGIRKGLIPDPELGPDATLEQRVRKAFPGKLPTIEEIKDRFVPGENPPGWEPVLRQALQRKYFPEEDIDAIVELTRQGTVPMIATMKNIPEYVSTAGNITDESLHDIKIEQGLTIRDTLSGFKVFGQGLLYLPRQTSAGLVKSLQGAVGTGVVNPGRGSKTIQLAHEKHDEFVRRVAAAHQNKKFLPGISIQDVANLPKNIAFSLISLTHGLAAGIVPALVPVPGARVAAVGIGTLASGKAAFNMASYEVMQNYLELADEDSMRERGRGINAEEEKKLKAEFMGKARKYGLWEAIPEMVGNVAQVGTVFAPLNRMLGRSLATRVLAKMGGVYAEELFTEAITEIGQSGIAAEAGFPGAEAKKFTSPRDWLDALAAVAPQTFLLTTTMGGAAATFGEVHNQLRSELGEDHDQFKRLLNNLRKRHPDTTAQTQQPVVVPDVELETGEPATIKMEEIPKALPVKTASKKAIEETTAASDFEQNTVEYLLETGMSHAEVLAASEVMRDMAFQGAIGNIMAEQRLDPVGAPETDVEAAVEPVTAEQWQRMAPVEGDTVIMPRMRQGGTLLRWNNDGSAQVSLPSGLKMKVERSEIMKANDLRVPLGELKREEVRAPVKSPVPSEFSPTDFSRGILNNMPDDRLLAGISMVGEGTNTAKEAVFAMSFGHPNQDLIRSLAQAIGEEVFIDLAVEAVSPEAATTSQVVEGKRQPVARAADPISQSFADTQTPIVPEERTPQPYMVPLNRYLLARSSPELTQIQNIKKSLPFQALEPKAVDRYLRAVEKVVSKYMPETLRDFQLAVENFRKGDASLGDIDQVYTSAIHNRLAVIQFADVMEQTGIDDPLEAALHSHRSSVAEALATGRSVSPEVLEDYPDLTGEPVPEQQDVPDVPDTEEVHRSNVEAQKERIKERGLDQPEGPALSVREVGPGGLPLAGREDAEFEKAVLDLQAQNPEMAEALNAGRDLLDSVSGLRERMKQWRRLAGELINPKLDKELRKIMPQYVDDKRTGLLTIATKAQVEASSEIQALWGDLNENERNALMQLIFARSLRDTGMEGKPLPRDVSPQEAEEYYNELVGKVSERAPELLNIMERYRVYMQSIANQLVDRGWMKPEDVKDFYAPHVVIDYTPHYFLKYPYLSKQGRKAFQGYTKRREGSVRDIFANEEAIISTVAQMKADMMFDDWVNGQLETYDIYPKMTPEAQLETFGKRPSGRIGQPQPHGRYEVGGRLYIGHQYVPGNMIYRANVVDESLLATAFQEAMEDMALAPTPTDEKMIEDIANRGFDAIEKYLIGIGPRGGNALRSVRALGNRNRVYLIPEDLYKDMKHLTSTAEYNIINEIMHDLRRTTSLWKTMTTQIVGGIPFHLRNEQGDVINMVKTAGWKPLAQVPRALKILKNIDTPENLSEFEQRVLAITLDKAVLEAGYLQELRARSFRLKGKEGQGLARAWNAYQRLSGYRELSNRVALVAYNLDRTDRGLHIEARDLKSQLFGLDMESQIGYVARNGLVDYGDVPAWYRRKVSGFWFPFATFYQKNLNNWASLVKGEQGSRMRHLPGALAPILTPAIALWLWNNYGPFRKVEEGLGYKKRKWFHANLWQWDYDDNGTPHKGLVWTPEHPVDLALESIGADRLLENIDYVRRGILTPEEAAAKQIYDFGVGGLRMGQRLLNPVAGAFLDIARNKSEFSGTIVPRDEQGLPDYDKLRHYWFPHFVSRVMTPLGQYMTEERGDKPPLEIKLIDGPAVEGQDPFDVNLRIPRRPVDFLRGLGFYTIDLDKELDRDWWQLRQSVGSRRAHQMRKLRTAYTDSPMDLAKFIGSDKAMQLMDDAWRKDFAVEFGLKELSQGKMPPRGTLVGYLASPTVQLEKARAALRRTKDPAERKQIEVRVRGLKQLRRLQDLERIRDEELPATFKQILRRLNAKIEKDNK